MICLTVVPFVRRPPPLFRRRPFSPQHPIRITPSRLRKTNIPPRNRIRPPAPAFRKTKIAPQDKTPSQSHKTNILPRTPHRDKTPSPFHKTNALPTIPRHQDKTICAAVVGLSVNLNVLDVAEKRVKSRFSFRQVRGTTDGIRRLNQGGGCRREKGLEGGAGGGWKVWQRAKRRDNTRGIKKKRSTVFVPKGHGRGSGTFSKGERGEREV